MFEKDFEKDFEKNHNKWQEFEKKLIYENRFFLKHEVIDEALSAAKKNTKIIIKNNTFYRARIYKEKDFTSEEKISHKEKYINSMSEKDDRDRIIKLKMIGDLNNEIEKLKSNFWGYPKGKNLMPTEGTQIKGGRGNPLNIRYLYLSDCEYTALSEVRPYLNSKVSIAKIYNLKDKTIADFSEYAPPEDFQNQLVLRFSTFCANEEVDYLPTQFIAELIKNNGFDGIKYKSSLYENGINYMFFNDKDFDDVESKLYEVKVIAMSAPCINKNEIPKVKHPDYFTFEDLKELTKD